ncbi:glycosyltransferase family 4 protein [Roseivivax isoporae]|uniref:Glycosyl transferase family 1 n=1 Tax=Roseivivax isoporae LMG 25204 TaxID=1449351 RepID=X7F7Z7_9RHOB|nr:glycosyltransferase family 4 protein [Roseivivax isoporae]ETX28925.1 glycosyl transferase family 1 [Roseivivax isoporae LMG 25204]
MSATVTFALPGSLDALTGGTIYDRRLCEALTEAGRDVRPLLLDSGFPAPGAAGMDDALDRLAAVPADHVLVVDGLAFGALDTGGLGRIRAPVVAMVHHPLALESGLPDAEADRLFRSERDNLAHARHVLVPSPHTASILGERYGVDPGRVTVARPGTDRPALRPDPAEKAAPPLILAVGMLHPRKGHDVLIDALAGIAGLDWQAVIAGGERADGERARLVARAEGHGIADRVRLPGSVPRDALLDLYRRATVFALATRYEGYGIVFDEALLNGLPIVSCRAGAVPDTVPADAGRVVPVDDADAFAGALRALLSDADHRDRLARAAAAAGARLPGWGDTARVAAQVFDSLV